ncbi:hypothetical protein MMC06_005684 [Schaereria dolodes]|nr:hypothetical protein [Schaereria dolodes]
MVRVTAVFPLLCAIVALILSLLCIFAGSKTGYIENGDILTLNTSMLGRTILNTSKSASPLLSTIEGHIEGDINGAIADFAKELNIHDFYSAHILDYCEGYYTPSAVSNATAHPTKNVTRCSNHTGLFHFDPTAILQSELKTGVNLSDLHWPSAIEDTIRTVETASKAMFVLYCIGVAFTGLAVLGAFIAVAGGGRLSAFVNVMLDFLAFFSLGIASAIATVIAVKVTNAVNNHGSDVGLSATKGRTFQGMTWAAVVLMLIACFAWIFECVAGRKKQVTYLKDGEEGRLY